MRDNRIVLIAVALIIIRQRNCSRISHAKVSSMERERERATDIQTQRQTDRQSEKEVSDISYPLCTFVQRATLSLY